MQLMTNIKEENILRLFFDEEYSEMKKSHIDKLLRNIKRSENDANNNF